MVNSSIDNFVAGLHDAFSLYGRPNGYSWNPRDPNSLMFAYPIGPRKDVSAVSCCLRRD